jgi:hypothetical protein
MATDQTVSYKFVWGAAVKIIESAPKKYLDIKLGSVCGIRSIETEATSTEFGEPVGSILYLIESPNGDAIEIPERFLIAF